MVQDFKELSSGTIYVAGAIPVIERVVLTSNATQRGSSLEDDGQVMGTLRIISRIYAEENAAFEEIEFDQMICCYRYDKAVTQPEPDGPPPCLCSKA